LTWSFRPHYGTGVHSASNRKSTRNISWGLRQPVRKDDNLTIFMCRLSWNLEASASWNTQGLSRPVMGLLYLYIFLSYSLRGKEFLDQLNWYQFEEDSASRIRNKTESN